MQVEDMLQEGSDIHDMFRGDRHLCLYGDISNEAGDVEGDWSILRIMTRETGGRADGGDALPHHRDVACQPTDSKVMGGAVFVGVAVGIDTEVVGPDGEPELVRFSHHASPLKATLPAVYRDLCGSLCRVGADLALPQVRVTDLHCL